MNPISNNTLNRKIQYLLTEGVLPNLKGYQITGEQYLSILDAITKCEKQTSRYKIESYINEVLKPRIIREEQMNKKPKHQIVVTSDNTSLLEAFVKELEKLGYKSDEPWNSMHPISKNYKWVRTEGMGYCFHNHNCSGLNVIQLKLPQDWNKALQLAAEFEPQHNFKEGEWLYKKLSGGSEWIGRYGGEKEGLLVIKEYYQISSDGKRIIGQGYKSKLALMADIQKATNEQIARVLSKVAAQKGFVKGVKIAPTGINEKFKGGGYVGEKQIEEGYRYVSVMDILDSKGGNGHIYDKGDWATILEETKEEKIILKEYDFVKWDCLLGTGYGIVINEMVKPIHYISSQELLCWLFHERHIDKDHKQISHQELLDVIHKAIVKKVGEVKKGDKFHYPYAKEYGTELIVRSLKENLNNLIFRAERVFKNGLMITFDLETDSGMISMYSVPMKINDKIRSLLPRYASRAEEIDWSKERFVKYKEEDRVHEIIEVNSDFVVYESLGGRASMLKKYAVKPTREEVIDYLIKECKKRYPKGTRFINTSNEEAEHEIKGNDFAEWEPYYNIAIHEKSTNGLLYADGNWAKVVKSIPKFVCWETVRGYIGYGKVIGHEVKPLFYNRTSMQLKEQPSFETRNYDERVHKEVSEPYLFEAIEAHIHCKFGGSIKPGDVFEYIGSNSTFVTENNYKIEVIDSPIYFSVIIKGSEKAIALMEIGFVGSNMPQYAKRVKDSKRKVEDLSNEELLFVNEYLKNTTITDVRLQEELRKRGRKIYKELGV